MTELGRVLILFGALLVLAGLILSLVGKIPWIGRLPGDFVWRRNGFVVYLPITTSILVSLLLTVLFTLFRR